MRLYYFYILFICIIILQITRLLIIKNKYNHVIIQTQVDIDKTNIMISECNKISDILIKLQELETADSKFYYDKNKRNHLSRFISKPIPNEYNKLISEHYDQQKKLETLTTHTGMYLPRIKMYQDYITKNILIGYDDYTSVKCEQYEIKINKKNIVPNSSDIYSVPNTSNLEIVYSRYSPNFQKGKLDTITIKRQVKTE